MDTPLATTTTTTTTAVQQYSTGVPYESPAPLTNKNSTPTTTARTDVRVPDHGDKGQQTERAYEDNKKSKKDEKVRTAVQY